MARPYRLQLEDCLYHITSRGDDRKKIFISEYDFKKFLEYLKLAKRKYNFYLYAYCLMSNHYHLLIETTRPNLSKIMQYVNTSYTTYYNFKRKRSGHLFQGRYKSIVVDKDSYFLELTRYIHLNPVKANLVKDPAKYQWSSYQQYIKNSKDETIDKKQISNYTNLKGNRYKQFVLEGINSKVDIFKNIYAGFILGRTNFIKSCLKDLKEQIEGDEISYKKKITKNTDIQDIIKAVSKFYGKSQDEIYNSKQRPMRAKQTVIYLMRRLTELTNSEIGKIFNMKYSAVGKAEYVVEGLIKRDSKIKKGIEGITSRFEV